MAQEVRIAGATYQAVPAISVPDSNNIYHDFVDTSDANATASDLANGKTAYVNGTKVTGTATGSTDFVVTLSWDSVAEMWMPDCTFADVVDADTAGKNIVFDLDVPSGDGTTDGEYDSGDNQAYYWVHQFDNGTIIEGGYTWTSLGVTLDTQERYILPNFETVNKTYTPTASSQTETVTFDSDTYNGLQQVNVTVNATPSAVLTGAPERVFVTPTMNLDTSTGEIAIQDVTVGTIQPIATAGWAATSQSIPVQVETSNTLQLSTQAATTITPTTSSQTAVAAGKYTTGAVTVAAMPSGSATAPATISGTSASVSTGTNTLTLSKTVSVTPTVSAGYVASGTAGNSSVSLTASVTTKGAATITPTTTNQTISSGTYLTGTQTISGDANLVAGNIKNGTTIFGVTGTYTGGGSGKATYIYDGLASRTANSYGSTSATVTVTKAGTYNISYVAIRGSSSGTMGTNLHIGSTTGTNNTTWNNGTYGQYVHQTNQSISANQAVTIYATSGSNSRTIYVGMLIVQEV